MEKNKIVLQMNQDQLSKLDNHLMELPYKISSPIITFLKTCLITESTEPVKTENLEIENSEVISE